MKLQYIEELKSDHQARIKVILNDIATAVCATFEFSQPIEQILD
jgi:hypothetical protein